ncbi:MAG: glucose-1-phosphate cytidylyltransferase [Candidatus Bilamarchaeum sp.]|jgi:glucose-1-phosphate cytidylyltransferase
MKAVILCGGQGTRLREETEFRPKPMVEIGGMPIVWHIMKIYAHFGINDFVLCLGYKGQMIKDYFLHKELLDQDVTINLRTGKRQKHSENNSAEDWNVTLADTGLNAMTGARVKKIQKFIGEDNFMLTYGDGLADVDIEALTKHHKKAGTIGTLTGTNPQSRFGMVKTDEKGIVTDFVEKPVLYDDRVNGGYYVFKKDVFDYLDTDDSCVLETKPLSTLAQKRQLSMYKHNGYWHCMDTYRDYMDLTKIWESGKVPWKVW